MEQIASIYERYGSLENDPTSQNSSSKRENFHEYSKKIVFKKGLWKVKVEQNVLIKLLQKFVLRAYTELTLLKSPVSVCVKLYVNVTL